MTVESLGSDWTSSMTDCLFLYFRAPIMPMNFIITSSEIKKALTPFDDRASEWVFNNSADEHHQPADDREG